MEGFINASGQWKYLFYTGQKFTTPKEAKDIVYLHSIESRRNLKLYKNDSVTIRARCDGKVPLFTMSQGTGPTGLNHIMKVGPSRSSGPTTRSKKRKNTSTNDDSQASSSRMWEKQTHTKLGGEETQQYPQMPSIYGNQTLHLQILISMSKAFRAKAKAERDIRGDHVLQYSMLRGYRDLLGFDGAFMKGPFPGQVLAAV
ncbi:hypothetical protein Tco_0204131 [Tanacetum coccineum]